MTFISTLKAHFTLKTAISHLIGGCDYFYISGVANLDSPRNGVPNSLNTWLKHFLHWFTVTFNLHVLFIHSIGLEWSLMTYVWRYMWYLYEPRYFCTRGLRQELHTITCYFVVVSRSTQLYHRGKKVRGHTCLRDPSIVGCLTIVGSHVALHVALATCQLVLARVISLW